MPGIKFDLTFNWEKVYEWTLGQYGNNMITQQMRTDYGGPAIYRWNIYEDSEENTKEVYIGECINLCPSRLQEYLRPGPSQTTSQRVHDLLDCRVETGKKGSLEMLRFTPLVNLDGLVGQPFLLQRSSLQQKYFRCLIENLLLCYYAEKGISIINKAVM